MPFNRQLALDFAENLRAIATGQLPPTVTHAGTDTQAVILRDQGRTVLLFPGTASGRDVLTDLDCTKAPWPDVRRTLTPPRAHHGFLRAFRAVAPMLADALIPGERFYVAGHSLGGALALLAADWLAPRVLGVYTYGQPRVFNGPAARIYNTGLGDETYRLVNRYDPIPHVPWVWGTYRHAGTEIFLDDAGLHVDPSPLAKLLQPVADFRDSAPEEAKRWISAQAHAITAYLARLKQ